MSLSRVGLFILSGIRLVGANLLLRAELPT